MKKKTLLSLLTIAMCLALIAGSTYALFTSEDKVDISVSSGKVDVNATILDNEMVTYSLGEKQVAGKFANGGTALFTAEKVLELKLVTPGDKVEFAIQLTNDSTVDIQYRLTWTVAGELAGHLVIDADSELTTDWAAWKTTDAKEKVINVTVELPAEFETQGLADAAISFKVEAVQANGTELYGKTLVSGLDALQTALENTEDKNIVALVAPIEIKNTVALDLNGKTVEGNFVLVDGANLTVEDGVLTNEDPSASAIQVNGGNLTLTDVEITSARHALRIEGDGSVVTINGGKYVAQGSAGKTQHALNVGESGISCTVVINGGTFIGPAGTAADSGSAVTVKAGSTVTINGGNFSGGKNNTLSAKGTLIVKGGTFDQDPSAFVAEGYKAVANADGSSYSVVAKDVVTNEEELSNAFTDGADTITMHPGTYTFPADKLGANDVLNAEGVVFEGSSKLNIDGATVVGATFSNPNGSIINQSTVNGTFKDCTFTGYNALRSAYAGDTVVFENCVFDGAVYGVHFDSGANDVTFRNCTFSGFNTMGAALTSLTLEGCTFKATGKSGYNGINLWGNAELKDCTFVFDGSAGTEWVDLVHNNRTVTFTNCVVVDAEGNEKSVGEYVGDFGVGNTITVDGETYVGSNESLKAAVAANETNVYLIGNSYATYDLNGIQKDGLTLIGVGNDVKVVNNTRFASGKAVGAITKAINLQNVTVTNTIYTMENGSNATFTNVNFAAGVRQAYGKNVQFTNCTFGSNSEGYALHFQTDSASEGGNIQLTGCDFEGGKVHLGGKRAYTFTDCDFATGTDFQVWSNITLENCTVDGVEITAENIATFFPNLNLEKVTLN